MSATMPCHRIETTFWEDATRLRWSRAATLLAAYVLSSPHRPPTQPAYHLPLAAITDDLGWPRDKAVRALRELIASGFVEYDEASGTVTILGAGDRGRDG